MIYKVQLQIATLPKSAISVEWSEKPHRMARKWVFFFGQEPSSAGGSLEDPSTLSFCMFIPPHDFVVGVREICTFCIQPGDEALATATALPFAL